MVEDGTTNGTITDFDGKFVLEVNTRATLRISYIGYIEKKIQIASPICIKHSIDRRHTKLR
ncbi:carboxypeptidase-like regulatory domain-containing protein (plasmid) [Parabacteroides distasonis]|nr:carboxypeptidase-like regulatory domain-containing protein [Parabacteroides distasonis]